MAEDKKVSVDLIEKNPSRHILKCFPGRKSDQVS